MSQYTQTELQTALHIVTTAIRNCEKIHPKFAEGTSQYSLLRNRIKALKISELLLTDDGRIRDYTDEDLCKALPPVISIRNKTEKARSKYEEGSTQYKRFTPTIEAMVVCEALIEQERLRRKEV